MIDTARVVDSLMRRRGEGAVIHTDAGDVLMLGVWHGPYEEMPVGGVAVETHEPVLAVRSLEYQASGARIDNTVTADPQTLATASPAFAANTWTIVSARPGDLGLTRLVLRAYS